MRLYDQFVFNRQIFLRHRLRTLLMLLAVAIGVASVILLTSLGEGARGYVDREFSALGNRILIVLPGRKETTGGGPPIYGASPRDLTLEDANALARIPGVLGVAPIIAGTTTIAHSNRSREVITLGSTDAFFAVRQLDVGAGRVLSGRSRSEALAVCVLGVKVKRELFGSSRALGKWVRVGDRRMRVIGVLEERGESLGLDMRDMLLIPVRTAEQLFDSPGLFRILLDIAPSADSDKIQDNILSVISKRHDGEEDVTVISQDSMLAAFDNILATLTMAIAAISSISLLVAGILIMNISLISVSQRRQEIGLLKAIGASSRQIKGLFIGESLMLISMGSVAGISFAFALIFIFAGLWPSFPLEPPTWAVPAALLVAFGTGLVFSIMPAKRAAALDPVLALRGLQQ
jgi:putative ABC transport system permease protein